MHILRIKRKLEDNAIRYPLSDSIPKEKAWTDLYQVSPDLSGDDHTNGYRLYTDGSHLDGNSGYGAVLMLDDDICDETLGGIGAEATVYQAE